MAAPDGAASFSVDLAQAPQAIADLKDARQQLQELQQDAYRMAFVTPPAHDSVSRDAATVLGQAAAGGPGSLYDALGAGITQLSSMIANLEHELEAYRRSDASSTRVLSRDA